MSGWLVTWLIWCFIVDGLSLSKLSSVWGSEITLIIIGYPGG